MGRRLAAPPGSFSRLMALRWWDFKTSHDGPFDDVRESGENAASHLLPKVVAFGGEVSGDAVDFADQGVGLLEHNEFSMVLAQCHSLVQAQHQQTRI
jgi:hypothetical protein